MPESIKKRPAPKQFVAVPLPLPVVPRSGALRIAFWSLYAASRSGTGDVPPPMLRRLLERED